jgi:hypothetical protein
MTDIHDTDVLASVRCLRARMVSTKKLIANSEAHTGLTQRNMPERETLRNIKVHTTPRDSWFRKKYANQLQSINAMD